ncbi:MAG: tetratricopeptide repeat protein, partial [Chitinophagaceae bacterium]
YTKILDGGWSSGDYATFQLGLISGINNSRQKIEWLTNLVRNYPNSDLVPDAYLEIAGTHLADERYEEAIPFLKQVTTSASSTLVPKAYLQLGIAYFNLNKNDEALQQYTTLLQRYPNSTEAEEALENARAVFVEEGRSAEYVEFARKMGKEVSVSQEDQLAYQEAEVQFNNGNFLQAVAKFEQYLSRFPNGKYALEANFYKSEIYFDQKEWAKAAAGYATLADRVPHKFGERSVLQSARLNFFDLKDFAKAKRYYEQLKQMADSREIRLEAMRGLLRSEFQLNQWAEAAQNARDLLNEKGIGTDDQVLANLALARSLHDAKQYAEAITYYRNVAQLSKAAYGAEARYQIAACYFEQRKLEEAEKAAFQVINGAGSYEEWVTKAYLLLGDIYF